MQADLSNFPWIAEMVQWEEHFDYDRVRCEGLHWETYFGAH